MMTSAEYAVQARRERNWRRFGRTMFLGGLILLALVYMVPLLWMIMTSLKALGELTTLPISIFPKVMQWSNYARVFQIVPFANSYLNSLIVTSSITVVAVITSTMAGYSFAKLQYPGRDLIFTGILATMMVPFFLLAIPLFYMLNTFGLIDTHLGLILPASVSAFGTFLMRQNCMSIPTDLLYAARIDGCSEFRIFWNIILPLAKSAIGTLVIFTFMGSWDEFMWALLVARSERMWTLALVIRQLQMADQGWFHLQMAGTTLAILPVVIMFIFAQKQIIQSVALSGMKL